MAQYSSRREAVPSDVPPDFVDDDTRRTGQVFGMYGTSVHKSGIVSVSTTLIEVRRSSCCEDRERNGSQGWIE